jgi:hypothetical protein
LKYIFLKKEKLKVMNFNNVLQEERLRLLNKRVRLIRMNDPFPIESGMEGTIYNIGLDILNVKWDNGRTLGLVVGEDEYEVLN